MEDKLQSSRRRVLINKLAHGAIVSSGSLVLVTLLLILCYLLYVVTPIFASASISSSVKNSTLSPGSSIQMGIDESGQFGYRVTDQGVVEFYGVNGDHQTRTVTIPANATITATTSGNEHQHVTLFGLSNGQLQLVHMGGKVEYQQGRSIRTPLLTYPLGDTLMQLDRNGEAITQLTFELSEHQLTVVWRDNKSQWHRTQFTGSTDLAGAKTWQREDLVLKQLPDEVSQLMMLPSQQNQLVALVDNRVGIWQVNADGVELRQSLQHGDAQINDMALLAGESSILLAMESGLVSQWFEARGVDGRQFMQVRDFQLPQPARLLATEAFRKSFAVVDDSGAITLLYSTSERQLLHHQFSDQPLSALAFSLAGDGLIVDKGNRVEMMEVDNQHPEISITSLWQQVWYEGYAEPEYVWQSTSGSEAYEAKFSLVPLVFGTIKAALFAVAFALPLAICGAIYTAFFMSGRVRTMVKPTIELMEALPTVILGFLAGLWLAPIVEDNLPAVLLLAVMLPLTTLLMAWGWRHLPEGVRHNSLLQYRELMLIPVLLFVGWCCFALSPWLELWLMDGDGRTYVTNVLGIDYNQRNALVVGIAMGFAVVPTIFSIAEDAIFSVPRHLVNGSLALGATQWQTLTRVVLVIASPGIFSAMMMGFGRAVGETMIVLMATGNTAIMKLNIFEGMRSLAANIAVEIPEAAVGSSHYRVLFLTALVLFLFTFLFNTLAELIRQRLRRKYSTL
nr:ABC transporter permease subunit [Ferrimonas lipolytica]